MLKVQEKLKMTKYPVYKNTNKTSACSKDTTTTNNTADGATQQFEPIESYSYNTKPIDLN